MSSVPRSQILSVITCCIAHIEALSCLLLLTDNTRHFPVSSYSDWSSSSAPSSAAGELGPSSSSPTTASGGDLCESSYSSCCSFLDEFTSSLSNITQETIWSNPVSSGSLCSSLKLLDVSLSSLMESCMSFSYHLAVSWPGCTGAISGPINLYLLRRSTAELENCLEILRRTGVSQLSPDLLVELCQRVYGSLAVLTVAIRAAADAITREVPATVSLGATPAATILVTSAAAAATSPSVETTAATASSTLTLKLVAAAGIQPVAGKSTTIGASQFPFQPSHSNVTSLRTVDSKTNASLFVGDVSEALISIQGIFESSSRVSVPSAESISAVTPVGFQKDVTSPLLHDCERNISYITSSDSAHPPTLSDTSKLEHTPFHSLDASKPATGSKSTKVTSLQIESVIPSFGIESLASGQFRDSVDSFLAAGSCFVTSVRELKRRPSEGRRKQSVAFCEAVVATVSAAASMVTENEDLKHLTGDPAVLSFPAVECAKNISAECLQLTSITVQLLRTVRSLLEDDHSSPGRVLPHCIKLEKYRGEALSESNKLKNLLERSIEQYRDRKKPR